MSSASEDGRFSVVGSEHVHSGYAFDVRVDQVRMPDGAVAARDVIDHIGAVGVLAMDEDDHVVLVRQYRPAIGIHLTELPAGLLDQAGEPALQTAQRELREEAALAAAHWQTLVDMYTSPGMSNEAIRIYLARGLSPAADLGGFEAEHEERTMQVLRQPLHVLVGMVLAGDITNGPAVAAIMAAEVARRDGWTGLRSATAPWPARPDRVPDPA
ncbi:MAG TPA: NUDIX hydrolase [Jatrophihabitans sp.]|nr:NUDIX hydrolase [Jatrophihabitans sp.]